MDPILVFEHLLVRFFNITPKNQIRLEFNLTINYSLFTVERLKITLSPPPPPPKQTEQCCYRDSVRLGGGAFRPRKFYIVLSLYTVILWTVAVYPSVIEYGQTLFGVVRNGSGITQVCLLQCQLWRSPDPRRWTL